MLAKQGLSRDPALMLRVLLILLALVGPAATALAAQRSALGIFDRWGAFRDEAVPRCYAIASPAGAQRSGAVPAYASIGYWPRSRIRGQFYVRLSRARSAEAELRLVIGSRRFVLTGRDVHGWANDARMDAAIIAALRSATSMRVESRGMNGRMIVDRYALRGAATAIDAAALGCARQGRAR